MAGTVNPALEALHLEEIRIPPAHDVEALKADYAKHGQEHVFAFWDGLSPKEQADLFWQLSGFKPEMIAVCPALFSLAKIRLVLGILFGGLFRLLINLLGLDL